MKKETKRIEQKVFFSFKTFLYVFNSKGGFWFLDTIFFFLIFSISVRHHHLEKMSPYLGSFANTLVDVDFFHVLEQRKNYKEKGEKNRKKQK